MEGCRSVIILEVQIGPGVNQHFGERTAIELRRAGGRDPGQRTPVTTIRLRRVVAVRLVKTRARIAARFATTSGVSIALFSTSPASPPVQHTRTVRTPSLTYFATVALPFDASSSGWACTVSKQSGEEGARVIAGNCVTRNITWAIDCRPASWPGLWRLLATNATRGVWRDSARHGLCSCVGVGQPDIHQDGRHAST